MATIKDMLTGLTLYPIPLRTLVEVAERYGCDLTAEASQDVMKGKPYNLSKAELFLWLSLAPSVSQGGQSYNFTDEQRQQFRNRANALFAEYGEENQTQKPIYGYKGSRL